MGALSAHGALAAPAGAQTIRGTLVDHADAPVPGVLVLLIDSANSVAARALSNESGEFRTVAPTAGVYRLRTLRIGFRPVLSDAIALRSGQELTQRIVLTGAVFSLDTVRIVGRTACRAATDSSVALFAVWEQARTALTAAMLTARNRVVAVTTVSYERTLDRDLKRIRLESSSISAGFFSRPWRSLSADSLRRVGYVVVGADNWTTYYAPDVDVLLSELFVEDHCFQLVTSDNPSRVGLAFQPTPERAGTPEIRGTMWFDKKTSELRNLEFRYANLSRAQENARAGGEIDFVRLSNGAWVVSHWTIRMPLMVQDRENVNLGVPGSEPVYRTRVNEFKIAGGELALITRGRDTLWTHPARDSLLRSVRK